MSREEVSRVGSKFMFSFFLGFYFGCDVIVLRFEDFNFFVLMSSSLLLRLKLIFFLYVVFS